MFWDEKVELWDGPAGKRIRDFGNAPSYYHHGNGEWAGIDRSADGKRLALLYRRSSGDMTGRIVDIDTGKDLATLTPLPMPRAGGFHDTCLSADGKRVAADGREATDASL
jgi:hypothetical protein